MKRIKPGTLVHYNEVARLMSHFGSRLTGNDIAVNAHVGGQFFFSPHPMALEAHMHHTRNHTSLLGYLSSLSEKENVPLAVILKQFCPENGHFINLYEAYRDWWKHSDFKDSSFQEYLDWQKKQKIPSTGYLDYSAGQVESYFVMKNYFNNLGIPADENHIVMGTGYKSLYHTLMNVLMTKDVAVDDEGRDLRVRSGGTILVPKGHYQSLVKAPSWHNSCLRQVEKLDREHIEKELAERGDIKALYFSVVANPSGEVMLESRIREIAETVLDYNDKNRDNPLLVIADQVYNGSILKDGIKIFSIASVKNEKGRMYDYTVTIVSPSKTLGYASARVGFATSGAWLPGDDKCVIARMEKVLDNEGCDGMEVSNEVGVIGAYSFSSRDWINSNSAYIRSQLERARRHVEDINRSVGYEFFTINDPDAGWYILSEFKRKNLPSGIENSLDLMVYFLNYNHGKNESGFKARPGAQFGYEAEHLEPMDYLILRSTLAMQPEDLDDFFRRFKEGVPKLAALKELEDISAEKISLIRSSEERLDSFISCTEKSMLATAEPLSNVFKRGITDEDLCNNLRDFSEAEMKAVLEEF